MLLVARIVAGAAAGGIFPVGIAVIGDLVPVKDRQVAIGRWLTAVITGNLIGSSLAGVVERPCRLARRVLRHHRRSAWSRSASRSSRCARRRARNRCRLSLSGFRRGYGSVFANPRAKVCFSAVFVEGIVIFGLFPFVALLLLAAGEPRASIAGAGDRGLLGRRRDLCASRCRGSLRAGGRISS